MPYVMRVLATRMWTEEAAEEEASVAKRWLDALREDDLSADDLRRELSTFGRDAPRVRIAVVAEGEEKDVTLYVVTGGILTAARARRAGRGKWTVEGSPELSTLVADMVKSSKTAEPARASPALKPGGIHRSALKARIQEAHDAIGKGDALVMLRCVGASELSGTSGVETRIALWKALARRPALVPVDQLFAALRDEVQQIALAIGDHVDAHPALAPRILEEIAAAWERRPMTDAYLARLSYAVRAWGDFPFPPGFIAAAEPALRRLLVPVGSGKGSTPGEAWFSDALESLERGELRDFRAARAACETEERRDDLAARFGARLRAVAGGPLAPLPRAAALDLLAALGVPAAELGPLTAGLPPVAGVRELRQRASRAALPLAPLVPGFSPPPASHDWRDVGGVAPYGDDFLVVNRRGLVTFQRGGATQWRFDCGDGPNAPLRILGDAAPAERNLVFVSSAYGVHALDRGTGKEVWCRGSVDVPSALVAQWSVDPNPVLWARPDGLRLLGERHVTALDWNSGEVLDVIALPFGDPRGFAACDGGVLVLDGTRFLDASDATDFLPSGLFLGTDGTVQDRLLPRTLGGIVREAGGVRADFSALDVVLDTPAGQKRFALPEIITRISRVFRGPDDSCFVLVFRRDPNEIVFGKGTWLALPLH